MNKRDFSQGVNWLVLFWTHHVWKCLMAAESLAVCDLCPHICTLQDFRFVWHCVPLQVLECLSSICPFLSSGQFAAIRPGAACWIHLVPILPCQVPRRCLPEHVLTNDCRRYISLHCQIVSYTTSLKMIRGFSASVPHGARWGRSELIASKTTWQNDGTLLIGPTALICRTAWLHARFSPKFKLLVYRDCKKTTRVASFMLPCTR